jgi:RNA polymerase sigma-70 factor, ECF subfamily
MKGGWGVNDFNEIYEIYSNQVYKYLVSLTKDAALAEELTQETFYQAIKSIHKFREDCKFSVWLCQIAKYSYYKYKKKHKNHEEYDIVQENLLNFENPEDIYEKKDSKLTILKAIHMLEEPYKEVISLRTYSELSFKEIGEIFDRTENWARITFYRGKTKLKEVLIK